MIHPMVASGLDRQQRKQKKHEHSEAKKSEKSWHIIMRSYQVKSEARTVQRYKQYLSDADKSDSTVTTTTLQQLEQRIQELECSLHNQTLV